MKKNGILIFVILLTTVAISTKAEVTEIGLEKTVAPAQIVTDAKTKNPVVQTEVVPAPAAPVAAPVISQQSEAQKTIKEDIRKFVNQWLTSWQSGDMETYRHCYTSDFRTKGMDLNAWITYKTNVRQKSKNINIKIEDLQISVDEKTALATAVFMQHYSSSIFKGTIKKKLSIKKINNEWTINKESISPVK